MPGWLEQRPLTFPTLAGYERAARIFQPETKKYSTKKTTERERESSRTIEIAWASDWLGLGLNLKISFYKVNIYAKTSAASGAVSRKLSLLIKTESNYLPETEQPTLAQNLMMMLMMLVMTSNRNETLIYFCGNLKQIALIPVQFVVGAFGSGKVCLAN